MALVGVCVFWVFNLGFQSTKKVLFFSEIDTCNVQHTDAKDTKFIF